MKKPSPPNPNLKLPLSTSIPSSVMADLKILATRWGITQAAIARIAIQRYVEAGIRYELTGESGMSLPVRSRTGP